MPMVIPRNTVTSIADLLCKNCVFYSNSIQIGETTCHTSNIPFHTLPESFCADGHFILNYHNQDFLLAFHDAYSALINPESVFDVTDEDNEDNTTE